MATASELTRSEEWGDRLTRRAAVGFITVGVILLGVGVLALIAAFSATIATVVTMGLLLIAAAITKIVEAFVPGRGRHRVLSGLFSGLLYGAVGFIFLIRPGAAAVAITAMLAVLFLVLGATRLAASLVLRPPKWGFAFLSGLASIILGIIVLTSWPISAVWLIGTLLGIEFIFAGIELIGVATTLTRVAEETRPRAAELPRRPPPPTERPQPPLS